VAGDAVAVTEEGATTAEVTGEGEEEVALTATKTGSQATSNAVSSSKTDMRNLHSPPSFPHLLPCTPGEFKRDQ